ncbi:MAG: glycerol-3-phosphate 1-O-acyltransferase PlsY [Bacilli bacterium]|nr:glycerol-3-phosphate 1-O-acyltransferase PlsY [Bacilli bacterium]
MEMFLKILFLLLTYLIGSIPFGLIICKLKGIDVRKVGSGNIGATNVKRALDIRYSAATFILDACKGALFVLLFRYEIIPSTYMVLDPALYGFVAVIGHSFPIYLKFKGGKSVATGAGFVFAYLPLSIPIAVLSFFILLYTTRYVSVSSLGGALIIFITSLIFYFIGIDPITKYEITFYFPIFVFLSVVIVYIRHSSNIKRLINGTESKMKTHKEKDL